VPHDVAFFPLHDAIVTRRKRQDVRDLLDVYDPNMRDSYGRSALHYAAIVDNATACKFLVKHGADVNTSDFHGASPLLYAAMKMHVDVIAVLLGCGAHIHQADAYGQTALHWATRHFSTAVLHSLVSHKTCTRAVVNQQEYSDFMSPLHWAIAWDGTKHVRMLLDNGADPTCMDRVGRTPLDYCIHFVRPDCLAAILSAHPFAVNNRNAAGATPLLHACVVGSTPCLQVLLKAKHTHINATDRKLSTALHEAVKIGRKGHVRRLLDRGANRDAVDADGNTPLMCAILNDDVEMEELFVAQDGDGKAPNADGSTRHIEGRRDSILSVGQLHTLHETVDEHPNGVTNERPADLTPSSREKERAKSKGCTIC